MTDIAQFGGFLPLSGGTLTGALGATTGTTALPGIFFAGDTSSGLSGSASGIAHCFTGNPRLTVTSTLIRGGSGSIFAWSSGPTSNTVADTGVSRVAAGVVGVGTGAAGNTAGTLMANIRVNNAYVAGAVVGTGSVTIQDSTGTTYRVPVLV
jgi:hypothetical protein